MTNRGGNPLAAKFYDETYGAALRGSTTVWNRAPAQWVQSIIDSFTLHGKVVLDAACGEFHDGDAFRRAGAKVVGMDLSPNGLAIASGLYGPDSLIRGDVTRLPFGNTANDAPPFDVMIWKGILLCLADTEEVQAVLQYASKELLKPDGLIVITSFHDEIEESVGDAHRVGAQQVNHWTPPLKGLMDLLDSAGLSSHPGALRNYPHSKVHPPNYLPHSHQMLGGVFHRKPAADDPRIWLETEWASWVDYLDAAHDMRVSALHRELNSNGFPCTPADCRSNPDVFRLPLTAVSPGRESFVLG